MSKPATPAILDCDSLPSIMARPLHDYQIEADPFVKLWCLCDLVEIMLRLLVAAGVAELAEGGRELPESLRQDLGDLIDRPTLGQWRVIASKIADHLPDETEFSRDIRSLLLAPPHGLGSLLDASTSEPRTAANSLLALRNDLAHGGASSKRLAAKYLALWQPRFEAAIAHHSAILRYWRLVIMTPAGLAELRGVDKAIRPIDLPEHVIARVRAAVAQCPQECVVLMRSSAIRVLWPLMLFGIPLVDIQSDPATAVHAALQLYRRREIVLQYTPIGSDEVWASVGGTDAYAAFAKLFAPAPASRRYRVRGFENEMVRDAAAFVGRRPELQRIRQLIAERSTGVLWLTGPAGIGKSFLVAKVVMEATTQGEKYLNPAAETTSGAKTLVLAYRFKAEDDPRCSTTAFCHFAIERLAVWPGLQAAATEEAEPDPAASSTDLRRRLQEMLTRVDVDQGYRVVFAIDGIDELLEQEQPRHRETADSTSTFIRSLPVACGVLPGVLWMCAGRPEAALQRSFDSPVCSPVFADEAHSLPAMLADDVREMLLSELEGPARRRLLGRDADSFDRAVVTNDFIDAVTINSQGLPLYVRLVLGEAKQRGTIRDFDPSKLPASLEEFYARLSRRFSLGGLQQYTSRVMAALAMAREPLSADTLLAILRAGNTFSPPTNQEIASRQKATLNDVLAAVSTLLNRGSTPDDETGYSLGNLSLREFLTDSSRCPEMEEALATTRIALTRYCCDRSLLHGPARMYILRNAIRHLLDLELWAELESLITAPYFLEAKIASGLVHELIDDVRRAIAGIPSGRPMHEVLVLIMNALRCHTDFIDRHASDYPQAVFQCIWNECTATTLHSDASSQCVASWLSRWREDKAQTPWLRSVFSSFDASTSREEACLVVGGAVMCIAACQRNRRLAVGCDDGTVCILDAHTGDQIVRLSGHRKSVCGVAFLANGRIASASDDGTLRIWAATAGGQCTVLDQRECGATAIAVSRNGCRLGAGWEDGSLFVWDIDSRAPPWHATQQHASITAVAITDDGGRVAFASHNGGIRVVETRSGKEIACMRGHSFTVTSVAFSPDGFRLASGARDGTARLWDAESGAELGCFSGHKSWVRGVAFSPDGTSVASVAGKVFRNRSHCDVRIWTVDDYSESVRYLGHDAPVTGVCWSNQGLWIATCSFDGTVRLWNTQRVGAVTAAKSRGGALPRTPFSPGGTLLALLPRDVDTPDNPRHLIHVINTDTGERRHSLEGHDDTVTSVAFAPQGDLLASGSHDRTVRVWDLNTATERIRLTAHGDRVFSVAFSRDGTLLASGSGGQRDDTVRVWETATEKQVRTFTGHQEKVTAVAFSPDGRLVATAAGDFLVTLHSVQAVIRTWDVLTGMELGRLERDVPVWDVAFSEDGNALAFASLDQSVERWDIRLTRNMSRIEGTFDLQRVLAAPPIRSQLTVGNQGRDCIVESLGDFDYRAWFPLMGPAMVTMNPDGRSFAFGTDAGVVGLVCFEGVRAAAHGTRP